MIFGDERIRNEIFGKCVLNATEKQIGPASLDIRLSNSFLRLSKTQVIRLGGDVDYLSFERPFGGEAFTIYPGEFVLASTIEKLEMPPHIAAFVQGRSSIGRIGLTIQNAGFIDPGFWGYITLELVNEAPVPIELLPGYPVGQLVFFDVSHVRKPYMGKYHGQVVATGSQMILDNWGQVKNDEQRR